MTIRPVARELAPLGPLAQLRAGRLGRRVPQLLIGLVLYGAALGMIVRATLGNAPWDVLHQGLARHLPISLGTAIVLMSVVVMLAWVPLRERPGLGTVLNTLMIGPAADLTLALLPAPEDPWSRAGLLVGGIVLNALATALYIGAQLGPGPRDGLMTGLHRRTGVRIGRVRIGLEVTVVAIGFVLGGVVGLGTLVYALTIGPLAQRLLPFCTVDLDPRRPGPDTVAGSAASDPGTGA